MVDYVSKNDFYEIRVASLITNLDRDSLLELYQPIIGARAASLYLTLSTQKKSPDGGSIFKTNQLLRNMQLTSAEFIEARHYLEAVGLIRTYEADQEDVRCYIYVIYSPKSPKAFFEDVLFSGLLIQSVGEKEAKKLANKWKVNLTIPEEYHEVSASFVDVYNLNYDDPSFRKDFGSQILGRDHGRAQLTFSYDLFFSYIKDGSSIDIDVFKKKDMKEIARLATLFGIDEKWMAQIIIDEYTPDSVIHFDFKNIKQTCEDMIRYSILKPKKQPNISSDTLIAQKIELFNSYSPAQYLSLKQNGTKPIISDLNIVNSLSQNFGFSTGVINVIVDYVLEKNNNVLSKNYVEKIAASVAREGLNTTVDVMNFLKRSTMKNNALKERVSLEKPDLPKNKRKVSREEVNALLDEMED